MIAARLTLCAALLVGSAWAATPGGSGTLLPPGGNAVPTCFTTGSALVPEICGTLQVHWKLSALMGEPVANFALVWSLGSVHVREGSRAVAHGVDRLPTAVAQAARRSQLMVLGLGTFQGAQGETLAVEVDTGAPSRPDGKPSFNVPGSPNWDRFIVNGSRQSMAVTGRGFASGTATWCDGKARTHVDPARAKAEMREGLTLTGLVICPGTTASVDALERALEQHCRTAPQAGWCEKKTPAEPVKPGMSQGDALDRAADKSAVQGTHARLLANFKQQAQAACAKEMAPLQACSIQACPVAGGPPEAQCAAVPRKPTRGLGPVLTSVDNSPCNAQCQRAREASREASRRRDERAAQAFEQKLGAWESQWGGLARECRDHERAHARQRQCIVQAEASCNPQGLSAQRCLDRRMVNAPGLAAAQTTFEKGARERQGDKSGTSRFLD